MKNLFGKYIFKIPFYLISFLIPPLIVGVIIAIPVISHFMTVGPPEKTSNENIQPPQYDPAKPTAVILVSNKFTEVTDLFAPYEILATSKRLNVFTLAPKRRISSIWLGVDIIPHYSFEEYEEQVGVKPDLIVIPNIADPDNKTILEWLNKNARGQNMVLSICEGARVLAASGLADGRNASSHFSILDELEQTYPNTNWMKGVRYVEDGNIISSGGVTASIDATFYALKKLAGMKTAQETAQELNYPFHMKPLKIKPFSHKPADFLLLFLNAGYDWDKTSIGVPIYQGIGEIYLASVLDTYPRSLTSDAATVSSTRAIITTLNGLYLVPQFGYENSPNFERIIIPGDDPPDHVVSDLKRWSHKTSDNKIVYLHSVSNNDHSTKSDEFAYDLALQDLAQMTSNADAKVVSTMIEYPIDQIQLQGKGWPFRLLLTPFAIGLVGIGIAIWLVKLLSRS